MFELEGRHIAELNDEDLRSLVGLLCESELRSRDLSTSAVTWGGNQNAPDGGIDVRVSIQESTALGGFLPNRRVGFQVKKTDFTPGLIGPEMRPSGQLRASIIELINERGAYIIASSGSDVSDSALKDRLNAMRSAVADKAGHADLQLDFYDRNRLATWTRWHPGHSVWVRSKIGLSIPGWRPYSSWAVSPDGLQDEYLLDGKARLHAGVVDDKGFDIIQGVERMRDILRRVRGVIRLTGLSGVGKTRLVQALFDMRVGTSVLDIGLAIYTDMNDNPSPQPTGMISDLIASRMRAILIIDNCAPDLHRRITELCRAPDSLVSVLTVEYDVQDDEPEGTEAFRLESSSIELISKLVARRSPSLNRLDVDKIAAFSGGNARVALALTSTLERNESVSGLKDEELFKRLFHQRQERDYSLLKAAQVCALLYSFEGEALGGEHAELPKIAALAEISCQQLYAKVAQLKQRDLVQRRSVWRAILPHAIANRLAKMALSEIPIELIEQQFDTERLLKSFSHRLSFLHESDDARRIAERWLENDGLIGNVSVLNEFGLALFKNIAPISPEATLAAIERALSGANSGGLTNELARRNAVGAVLRSIAYDASLFNRCVAAMVPVSLAEPSDSRTHPVHGALEGLFHIVLSGTHATIEQRICVADDLLSSSDAKNQSLGLKLLRALLKAGHFSATHPVEFGARSRNYGYWPSTLLERLHWFAETLRWAQKFAVGTDERAALVRSSLAQSIQNVWFLGPGVQEQYEKIASGIAGNGYWKEGWIAARSVLSRPLDNVEALSVERLRIFERSLRPKNTVDEVRAVVLTQKWGALDYAAMDEGVKVRPLKPLDAYEKANFKAEEMGTIVAYDQTIFVEVLSELVVGDAGRLVPFGKGLALALVDRRQIWDQLVEALVKAQKDQRNMGALIGFLNGLSIVDAGLCDALLEEALVHATLGAHFPILQTSVEISEAGVDRLKRALALGTAPVRLFSSLGWGRSYEAISDEDLRTILLALAEREGGHRVAIEILSMRFHPDSDQKKEYPLELIETGRILLSSPDFSFCDDMHDYNLNSIANVCLRGLEGAAACQQLCEEIKRGFTDYTFRTFSHLDLLRSIFQLQPRIALDTFFGAAPAMDGSDLDIDDFDGPSEKKNPLDGVPDDELLGWCDEKPSERYPSIARVISYKVDQAEGGIEWTPLAMEMLRRAPNPLAVLERFVDRFSPSSWSGSRATIIESRIPLLDRLGELRDEVIAHYVRKTRPRLVDDVNRTRNWEDEWDSKRDERFE